MNSSCKLCQKRRARRLCPGVGGEICAVCCGTERENTIECPSQCEYLQDARKHELPAIAKIEVHAEDIPNRDINVNEEFIRAHEGELLWLAHATVRAMESAKAVDDDAREALAAMIQTYRTLESGLIYDTRPQNPYAARVQDSLKESVEELRKKLAEETGLHQLRDSDVLGTLVFLQRLELQYNNGRRRGRAFYDFLRGYFPVPNQTSVAL